MNVQHLTASILLCSVLAAGSAARAAEPAIPIVIQLGSSGLPAQKVEHAIERELGFAVHADAAAERRIEVAVDAGHVRVSYFQPGHAPETRTVDLPRDPDRAVETIALLTGNLARDEAGELLAELRAQRKDQDHAAAETTALAAGAGATATSGSTATPAQAAPDPSRASSTPGPQQAAATPNASSAVAAPKAAPTTASASAPSADLPTSPVNLSFFHPIALVPHSEQRAVNLELGFAYSRVGAVRGFGLSLGVLRTDSPGSGFTHGLFWNRSGPFDGVQTSALVDEGHGALRGIDFAGLAAYREGDIQGIQTSGVFGYGERIQGAQITGVTAVSGPVTGAQVAGVVTAARGDVEGLSVAGVTSVALGDVRGAQVSGVANVARAQRGLGVAGVANVTHGVEGVQVAGVANTADDLNGLQLSLVNVGGHVRGAQIGLVNVSREIHGGALGLVNIAGNGRIQPAFWAAGPHASVNGGVQFLTDYTYALLGVGYIPNQSRLRSEAGAGLHLGVTPALGGELGVHYADLHDVHQSDYSGDRHELHYRLRVHFELLPGITPFVGGGVVERISGPGANVEGEYLAGVLLL